MVRNAAHALAETVKPVDSASKVFMQPHSPRGMKPRLVVLRAIFADLLRQFPKGSRVKLAITE